MWVPVVGTLVLGVLLVIFGAGGVVPLRDVLGALIAVVGLAGLYGFYRHLVGVGGRVDGYKLRNFLVGPPVVLPLMITALSGLGLLAVYWR